MPRVRTSDERGIALIFALFLAMVVAGIAMGVVLMSSNGTLIAKFHANEAMMEAASDGGLEQGRDTLNGNANIVPVGLGFVTLETNASVRDASGTVIAGFTRSLYAGPNGDTTGQFGEFASVISVISNPRGAVVVRRMQLKQDSFARFARFFNTWTCCMWGSNEVIFGPVHSNQGMAVQTGAPGATFWGPVTVVTSVTNAGSANWNGGYTPGAAAITFPTTATLTNLLSFATTSQTVVTGWPTTTDSVPDTRIEFVPLDLNVDGDVLDADEGFFRVWKISAAGVPLDKRKYATARDWLNMPTGVPASMPAPPAGTTSATDPNLISPNCGGTMAGDWWTADSIYAKTVGTATVKKTAVTTALTGGQRRCFLGGDRRLYPDSLERISNGNGTWLTWAGWAGAPPASLVNAVAAQGVAAGQSANAIAQTYWPITRNMNVNFKGIIYVNGSIAISGTVRGRVSVVTTGNIMLADRKSTRLNSSHRL